MTICLKQNNKSETKTANSKLLGQMTGLCTLWGKLRLSYRLYVHELTIPFSRKLTQTIHIKCTHLCMQTDYQTNQISQTDNKCN